MSIRPADQLTLRLTVIGGETRADDYVVIWNGFYVVIWDGFTIGRIMKQSGLPPGRPVMEPHLRSPPAARLAQGPWAGNLEERGCKRSGCRGPKPSRTTGRGRRKGRQL